MGQMEKTLTRMMLALAFCLLLTASALAAEYSPFEERSKFPIDYGDDFKIKPGSNIIYNFKQTRRDQPPQLEMREEDVGTYLYRRTKPTNTPPTTPVPSQSMSKFEEFASSMSDSPDATKIPHIERHSEDPAHIQWQPEIPTHHKGNPETPTHIQWHPEVSAHNNRQPETPAQTQRHPEVPTHSQQHSEIPNHNQGHPKVSMHNQWHPEIPAPHQHYPEAPTHPQENHHQWGPIPPAPEWLDFPEEFRHGPHSRFHPMSKWNAPKEYLVAENRQIHPDSHKPELEIHWSDPTKDQDYNKHIQPTFSPQHVSHRTNTLRPHSTTKSAVAESHLTQPIAHNQPQNTHPNRGTHKFSWNDLASTEAVQQAIITAAPYKGELPPSFPTLTPWSGDDFGK